MGFYRGTTRANVLTGTSEQDVFHGLAGGDTIYGDAGPGDLRPQVLGSSDLILADAGNDRVFGNGGQDYIDGGTGNDTINGGTGADWLWGSQGRDVFQYTLLYPSPGSPALDTHLGVGNRDVIWDWEGGSDKIDLRGWENGPTHLGAQFIGQDAAHFDVQLLVGFRYEGDNTIVELSRPFFEPPPGSTPAYFRPAGEIEILGHHVLQASDFIF